MGLKYSGNANGSKTEVNSEMLLQLFTEPITF